MKSAHFSQPEFQAAMAKCVTYGDETAIAEKAEVSNGIISRYLNANEEQEGCLFKAACVFTAWIDTRCSDGETALQTFTSFVSRALPCADERDIEADREAAYREHNEFVLAEAQQKPMDIRIKELRESIEADKRLLDDLIAEDKRYRQRDAFPGQTVSHSTRAIGQRVVNGGRG